MRIIFFIIFFYIMLMSKAFAGLLLQPSLKNEASSVSTEKVSQQDWSGLYAGLILGPQFGRSSDTTGSFGYNADSDKWSYDTTGFNAGAELGYNYFLHGLVMGPEIELGYLGVQGSGAQPASPNLDTVGKTSSDFYTAFRARIGVNMRRSLFFVTGGAIGVDYNTQIVDQWDIAPSGGSTVRANHNHFVWGYIAGCGLEHLMTNTWSLKLEYLYFRLNDQSIQGTTNLGNTYDWTAQTVGNMIRVGLNYHF